MALSVCNEGTWEVEEDVVTGAEVVSECETEETIVSSFLDFPGEIFEFNELPASQCTWVATVCKNDSLK